MIEAGNDRGKLGGFSAKMRVSKIKSNVTTLSDFVPMKVIYDTMICTCID